MSDKLNKNDVPGPADPLAEAALNIFQDGQNKENGTEGNKQDEQHSSEAPGQPLNGDSAGAEHKTTENAAVPEDGEAAQGSKIDLTKHEYPSDEKEANASLETEEQEMPAETDAPAAVGGGLWATTFNGLAKIGPLALIIAITCLSWHDFVNPDNAVYCPAEIKSITAFLHSVAQGSWLTPTGLDKGLFSLAQWPGFYWFIGLFALIPGLDNSAMLLPMVEASAATLAVLGVWTLAWVAGFGVKAAFAAGVILLCIPLFAPLPHFMGGAALAAGWLIWALVFFYLGWRKTFSLISLCIAFILTALAGLTGGVLHFITPLAASLVFLIWTANLRRAQAIDALIGFILMLCLIGGWLGWVILGNDSGNYLSNLFSGSLRFSFPPLWFVGLVLGIAGTMPWLLMVFGVSWVRVGKQARQSLSASRHDNGSAMIWSAFVMACIAAIFVPGFHPAAVAIACILCVLLGKAAPRLGHAGNPFFYLLASILLIAVGAVLMCLSFESTQALLLEHLPVQINPLVGPTLLSLTGAPIMAALLILGGAYGLFFVRRNRHCGGLVYGLLLVIILTQIGRLMIVPELAAKPDLPLQKYADIVENVKEALAAPVINAHAEPAVSKEVTPPAQEPVKALPESDQNASVTEPEQNSESAPAQQAIPQNTEPLPDASTSPANPQEVITEEIIIEKVPDISAGTMPNNGSPAPEAQQIVPDNVETTPNSTPAVEQNNEKQIPEAPQN